MNAPSREDLLGFLLGALEAQQQRQVADCLQLCPQIETELRRIKSQIAPLEWSRDEPVDFPPGLARRTCELVARESRQGLEPTPIEEQSRSAAANRPVAAPASRRIRLVEAAALVCCAGLMGAAIGPLALHCSRSFTVADGSHYLVAAPDRPLQTRPQSNSLRGMELIPVNRKWAPVEWSSFDSSGPNIDDSAAPWTKFAVGRWNDWENWSEVNRERALLGDANFAGAAVSSTLLGAHPSDPFGVDVQLISN